MSVKLVVNGISMELTEHEAESLMDAVNIQEEITEDSLDDFADEPDEFEAQQEFMYDLINIAQFLRGN